MQIKVGKFDINKALSLLRLYNLLPDQMDLKLVGSILIQALLRLPEPDFNLAMLLIPERMQVRSSSWHKSATAAGKAKTCTW